MGKVNKKDAFPKLLGRRIREFRIKKKLSLRELGLLCDIEKSNIGRIENGRTVPTVSTLRRICNSLEISLKELFDFEDEAF